MDSGSGQLSRDVIPRRTSSIALMEKQDTRSGLRGGKITSLQNCAIRCFNIDNAWRIARSVANKKERD
jgi:hypothetical protein